MPNRLLCATSLCLLLAACGGGSGDGINSAASTSGSGAAPSAQASHTDDSVFSAKVTAAPADRAVINGKIRLEVRGDNLMNVELLPANGYDPKYGVFTISDDGHHAWLDFDTRSLPEGAIRLRISAFDVPPGESGAREIIAMPARTWDVRQDAPPPAQPFSATLAEAPDDGAQVSGMVRLEVRGQGIVNAELLPEKGYTPRLGVFNVSKDRTHAWLDFDTRMVPDGVKKVRISAFDVGAGQPGAREIVAMKPRSWQFSNGATEGFTATLVTAPAHGAKLEGTTRLVVRGQGLQNVELLPAHGYSPKLGVFMISADRTYAWLDLDAATLPAAAVTARISAFNVPAGQSQGAREIVVMPPRQWDTPVKSEEPADGPLTDLMFHYPGDLTSDANGNLYFISRSAPMESIQRITPDGEMQTVIAREDITAFAVSRSGEVYFHSLEPDLQSPGSNLSTYWQVAGGKALPIYSAPLGFVSQMVVDPQTGDLIVAGAPDLLRITTSGRASTLLEESPAAAIAVAGDTLWFASSENGAFGNEIYRYNAKDGLEVVARFSDRLVDALVHTEDGIFYGAYAYAAEKPYNYINCRVYRLDVDSGDSMEIAGDDGTCAYRDGRGRDARFNRISSITDGTDGHLYVPDTTSHVIRRVFKTGETELFAGSMPSNSVPVRR